MRKEPKHARLSKRDIALIVSVVGCARRNGWTVAEVVEQRLAQNEAAQSECRDAEDTDEQGPEAQEAREAMCRVVAAETRRIRRLQRRFASWRTADTTEPSSREHDAGESV